ncbi:MAG: hypothetical protein WDZ93_03470 [Candidatus Paceibacterota bacterium]
MKGIVAKTFVYPMKGLHGIETPSRGLEAHTRLGVVGDRNFAVFRKQQDAPTAWRPKGQFHVCVNTEGMAPPHALTESDLDGQFRPGLERVRELYSERGVLNETTILVDTEGKWHLSDTPKPCVSFLNLASVAALEEFMGAEIDPHRFRMNVWVEGLEPFAELEYIKGFENGSLYPAQVHGVRFGIDDVCERCRAIEQSPESGTWNTEFQASITALLKERGYAGSPHRGTLAVMGWLAIPENNDLIRQGHQVTFG